MDGVTEMFAPLRRLPPSLLLHTRRRRKQIPRLFLKIITVTLILTDSRRTLGLFQWRSTYHTTTAKYQGNYRDSVLLSCRACVRALEDTWVHIPLSFVWTLSSLALLFLSVALSYLDFRKNIFELQHSLCSMLFFSHKRNTLPLGNRFPHTHTHKNWVTQNHLGILAALRHTSLSLSPSFGQFFHHLFSFLLFLALFLSRFLHEFLTTRKRKFAQSISSLQFQGGVYSFPPQLISDTMAHMLSISFQLRHDWALIAIFHRSPADKNTHTHKLLPFLKWFRSWCQ